MFLRTMTLSPALNARSLERVIRLLLYLLVRNYQNLKTVSVLYVSIKLLHNGIPILMGHFRPEIPVLMGLFYSRIPILMGLFHFGIPILMGLSQILNWPNAETSQGKWDGQFRCWFCIAVVTGGVALLQADSLDLLLSGYQIVPPFFKCNPGTTVITHPPIT